MPNERMWATRCCGVPTSADYIAATLPKRCFMLKVYLRVILINIFQPPFFI